MRLQFDRRIRNSGRRRNKSTFEKQPRVRLLWFDKKLVLDECRRRQVFEGEKDITEICTRVKSKLKLNSMPSYRILLTIIRDADRINEKVNSTQKNMKEELHVSSMTMENKLLKWVWQMWENEVFINDLANKTKAQNKRRFK